MNINQIKRMPCGTIIIVNEIEHENKKSSGPVGREPYIYVNISLKGEFIGKRDYNEEIELDEIELTFQRRSINDIISFFQEVKKELEIVKE